MAPHHFRGTIVFAVFDGEELGLWGSDHYAEAQDAATQVAGDLNNDIIGNTHGTTADDPKRLRVFSQALPPARSANRVNLVGSENDSPSRELARFVGDRAAVRSAEFRARRFTAPTAFCAAATKNRSGRRLSSHSLRRVARKLHPSASDVRVENGVQYGDLPQFMDWDYLARDAQNVAALATLALGPDRRAKTEMLTKSPRIRLDVTVAAVAGRNVVRNRVARDRRRAMADCKDVGNVTEATVPVSKDDYVLGVRASTRKVTAAS